jgi:glycosyltransferase involved in cell wall biosynthesis
MADHPLVSIIVPTRNNAGTLESCLRSIRTQTYPVIEIIVVDRDSTDGTIAIAGRYTNKIFNHGPERSAQRNFAASKATGQYLLFIDSDMQLAPTVVAECLAQFNRHPGTAAVTIPETSFGQGFWAKCKALERSYYHGIDWIECPRFMPATVFQQSGGYNETVAGGEDWELTTRLAAIGPIARITAPIRHDEGRVHLRTLVRKRVRLFGEGWAQRGARNHYADGPRLLALYFSRPLTTLRHPLTWLGMMFMRTLEMSARVVGLARSKSKSLNANSLL